MTKEVRYVVRQLRNLWDCRASDFRGQTLRDLFTAADREHGVWACWSHWTDAELDTVLGR